MYAAGAYWGRPVGGARGGGGGALGGGGGARCAAPPPAAGAAGAAAATLADFDVDEVLSEQLTRNVQFFGLDAQKRISRAFVVVVGLGVSARARAGVRRLARATAPLQHLAAALRNAAPQPPAHGSSLRRDRPPPPPRARPGRRLARRAHAPALGRGAPAPRRL